MKTYISKPEQFEGKSLKELEEQHVNYCCGNRDNNVRLYDIIVERELTISTKKPSIIKLEKFLDKIRKKHKGKFYIENVSKALSDGKFTLNVSYCVDRKITNKMYNKIQNRVDNALSDVGKFNKEGGFKNFE